NTLILLKLLIYLFFNRLQVFLHSVIHQARVNASSGLQKCFQIPADSSVYSIFDM
ncbi:hypothetical protein C0J52_11847, partial [Blattella germanica]